MLNLITEIAIYDPDATDHVILKNIMEGVDGSASFSYSQEVDSVMIEDGQTLEHSLSGTLDIKVLRGSDAELALIDAAVGKRVYVAGKTLNGFLIFSGMHYVNRVPDFNSSILNDHIRLTFKDVKGFSSENGIDTFYGGKNMLGIFDTKIGFTDEDNNEVISGFRTSVSSASYSVTNDGFQYIQSTSAGNGGIQVKEEDRIFWPFSEEITFSYTYDGGGANLFPEISVYEGVWTSPGNSYVQTGSESNVDGANSVTMSSTPGVDNPRFYQFRVAVGASDTTEVAGLFGELRVRIGTYTAFTY